MKILFVVLFSIVFLFFAYFEKKQLNAKEIYPMLLFSVIFAFLVDLTLGLVFNQYFYFEKGVQIKDYLFHFFIYPSVCSLYLNKFPFQKSKWKKLRYILGWTIFSLICEYIYIKLEIFSYQRWELFYSALCYPVIFLILNLHLQFIRYINKRTINQTG